MDEDILGRLVYLGLLLLAISGWIVVEMRREMGKTLRTAAAWGLIFLAAVAGHGLWKDVGARMSPQQTVTEGGTIELPRRDDGHYYATLTINGEAIEFLADTGATTMVLSQDDARRLGIDPEALVYLGEASTANGIVRTARIELDSVDFGPFRDTGFPAWVNDGEMDGSLLGMDYLGLYRIEIDGDRMILSR
jgi:aspartyl protease family protein